MYRQLRVPRNFLAGVSTSSGEKPVEGQEFGNEKVELLNEDQKIPATTSFWRFTISILWLKRTAWIATAVHLVSAGCVFGLWISGIGGDRPTSQVQRTAVCWSANMTMTNHIDTEHSFAFDRIDSIAFLISVFFLLSAVGQFRACIREDYINQIKLNAPQKYRYFEYSVSASLMMISIFLSFGLLDMYLHLCVFFLTFLCMLIGYIADVIRDLTKKNEKNDNSQKNDNSLRSLVVYLHYLSWVPVLVPWVILVISVADLNENVFRDSCTGIQFMSAIKTETENPVTTTPTFVSDTDSETNLPWFVWVVLAGEGFLFTLFGFVQQWQFAQEFHFNMFCLSMKTRPTVNTKFLDPKPEYDVERTGMVTEWLFLMLSLSAKFLLGWVIFSQVVVA